MELAEIRTSEEDWWSLGFEAAGPTDLLRTAVEATAALLFAQALPGGVELGQDDSRSYAQWLDQRPGTIPEDPSPNCGKRCGIDDRLALGRLRGSGVTSPARAR
jgi:hypothetical protein